MSPTEDALKVDPVNTDISVEDVYRRVLTVVTTLLVILAALWVGALFYNTFALIGMALVMTYILLWPVGVVEDGICKLSTNMHRIPSFEKLSSKTPTVSARLLSVMVVYVVFFSIMTVSSLRLFPVFTDQLESFAKALPRYVGKAESVLIDWSGHWLGDDILKQFFKQDLVSNQSSSQPSPQPSETSPITETEKEIIQQSLLRRLLTQGINYSQEVASQTVNNVWTLFTGTLTGLFYFLTGAILVFYFLLIGKELHLGFLRIFSGKSRETARFFTHKFHEVMFAFVKGQVLLGILTGFYMFLVLTLFDVKYAIVLSVFFALAEILPVVGTYIAITPVIIVILFSPEPLTLIPVWLCSYGFQTIKDNILAPKIVGDVMGLHPVVVILAIVFCAKAAGIVGILLALPLASLINITLQFIFNPKIRENVRQKGLAESIPQEAAG